MANIVYLNGQFMPAEKAKISVFDHGFLYGDGLFETMRAYNSRIFLLEQHLDRLFSSSLELGLSLPFSIAEITNALNQIVLFNGSNLYIRLTVSRGPGPVGIDPGLCLKPTVVITSKEIKYNDKLYEEGAAAIFVKTLRNLSGAVMPEIKSLNFLNNILAKREVIQAGADEGFMLNYLGQVAEGTVSNIFLVRDGVIFTPATDTGLLAGITRAKVIDIAQEMGFAVREQILTRTDFDAPDEVFYTNSGSEIVPVSVLNGQRVGQGRPGKIALKILKQYRFQAWEG